MTFFLETLRLGLANILLHKLRSLLTALGIIIGVGAVVAISAYGEGSKRAALAGIRELGANNILLKSVKPPASDLIQQEESSAGGNNDEGPQVMVSSYGLTRLDLRRLEQPTVGPIERMVPLKQVGSFIYRGAETVQAARVYGTLPSLFQTLPMRIARGRPLDDADQGKFNAVIGADAASHLFRLEDALGSTFSIDGQPFTVVGILEPIGVTAGRDINFDIFIPLEAAESRFGDLRLLPGGTAGEDVELSELIIRVADTSQVLPVAAQVRRVIEAGHAQQDVQVTVPLELIKQREDTANRSNRLMIVVGALSLLVGGIGIMNIMLASVTERTREIGIRRALGATRLHIVSQFLVETTVLAGVGGVIGLLVASGWCLTHAGLINLAKAGPWSSAEGLRAYFIEGDAPILMPLPMIVGFAFAAAVGVLFGVYPAIKASQQDPIVALRHD
ncbi:MAG: ABC transporter permease [Phycisphaerales bacterium JB063]